jgi:hypothetical protein
MERKPEWLERKFKKMILRLREMPRKASKKPQIGRNAGEAKESRGVWSKGKGNSMERSLSWIVTALEWIRFSGKKR